MRNTDSRRSTTTGFECGVDHSLTKVNGILGMSRKMLYFEYLVTIAAKVSITRWVRLRPNSCISTGDILARFLSISSIRSSFLRFSCDGLLLRSLWLSYYCSIRIADLGYIIISLEDPWIGGMSSLPFLALLEVRFFCGLGDASSVASAPRFLGEVLTSTLMVSLTFCRLSP